MRKNLAPSLIPSFELQGLKPRAWVCVGAGFSREDLKEYFLAQGISFVGEVFTSSTEIARKIIAAYQSTEAPLIAALTRQEVLRTLIAEPRIAARLGEVRKLKRQRAFLPRLDRAIQMGRMSFLHWDEEAVYGERLALKYGLNPLRDEIRLLAQAFEAWLEGSQLWDPPLLLRKATEILESAGWPAGANLPEKIYHFKNQASESLEHGFWQSLERLVLVEALGESTRGESEPNPPKINHERWHTLDDASDCLAEILAQSEEYSAQTVLIPDSPSVRRSLKRALSDYGVALADPRDPTRLRWEESLKSALLPLQMVARNFERSEVIAWILEQKNLFPESLATELVREINERGIVQGLGAYAGGKLNALSHELKKLFTALGGRRTCVEIATSHLDYLRARFSKTDENHWLVPFFEQVWEAFVSDLKILAQAEKKAPLLFWVERLSERVNQTASPVERLKPRQGIATYRIHQAPLTPQKKIWILGMPSQWLSGEGSGDYWFSEKDREVLSSEFMVRSTIQIRQERIAALGAWFGTAVEITILDAIYDLDGKERETILPILEEAIAASGLAKDVLGEAVEKGCHSRWKNSFNPERALPPQNIELPPLGPTVAGLPEISATALDRYSRCGLQGLVFGRWKLWDTKEPDSELWPEVRGNLLHDAVRLLVESRAPDGKFAKNPLDCLDEAWAAHPPKGLLRGERVKAYAKRRLLAVLQAFCEKEHEYFTRAKVKTVALDNSNLRLDFPDFAVVGKPDRIDENEAGLFIIDYKSSSVSPHGCDMLEQGYRLQLPFYALAAQKQFKKDVTGVQFVELTRAAGRSRGMFFKDHNGKEDGKFTQLRSNSKSLLDLLPNDAWARLSTLLEAQARAFAQGRFMATPKQKQECTQCMAADVCGYRRKSEGKSEGEMLDD